MSSPLPIEVLRKYWGYSSFRPAQEEAIRAILSGRDVMVVFATGGGKSLCYQVPALCMEGLTLVISPLIALMQDQVDQLQRRGVAAAMVHSGMSHREQMKALERCAEGRAQLLYLAPERLRQESFRQWLRFQRLSFVAVDEAHCISQWGYDFRPSYLQIKQVRELHPTVQMMALTATATPEVLRDIQQQLQFGENALLVRGPFFRKNLALHVQYSENKLNDLYHLCSTCSGSQIVYVRNRRLAVQLAQYFRRRGLKAEAYHAGMTPEHRRKVQDSWMDDDVRIICATSAFGMGIDKPDVRLVVHFDVPDSLEAYYQEAGRAGRDGQLSRAILLYNNADWQQLQKHFQTSFPPWDVLRSVYERVCQYYKIPIGAQPDGWFVFDLEALSAYVERDRWELSEALQELERQGYIELTDSTLQQSMVQVDVDWPAVQRLARYYPKHAELVQVLLRRYEGITTLPTRISLASVARILRTDTDRIDAMLRQLHHWQVVDYRPSLQTAGIRLLTPRVDAATMRFDKRQRQFRLRAARARLQKMHAYVHTDQCRYAFILRYFGDSSVSHCGHCDRCTEGEDTSVPNLEAEILNTLSSGPATPADLMRSLSRYSRQSVLEALDELCRKNMVRFDGLYCLLAHEQREV